MTMCIHSKQPNPLIAGFHSSEAYSYPKEDSHAIIRTIAYRRKNYDHTVIWFPVHTHSDVASSLAADYREPTASLGELARLPLELMTNICLQLDIQSLFSLRQVNARGQQIVNSIHEYCVIIKHALNAFLALLRTRKTPGVTLEDFYSLLCTQECSLCGHYGDLVYLPTWVRCCSPCLHSKNPALNMRSLRSVRQLLNISRNSLRELPKIRNVPGTYGMTQIVYKQRMDCVTTRHAIAAHKKEYGDRPIPESFSQLLQKWAIDFMVCCALPSYNPQNNQVECGVSCSGCRIFLYNVVDRPCPDWAKVALDMVYSHSEYLEHFAWCEQAQLLWGKSVQGTRDIESLVLSYRRVGFYYVE